MQFPKLTPLQSRFAISLSASLILVLIYFFLWSPHVAYAAEIAIPGIDLSGSGVEYEWAQMMEAGEGEGGEEAAEDGELVEEWQDAIVKRKEEPKNKDKPDSKQDGQKDQSPADSTVASGVSRLGGSNIPGALNLDGGDSHTWLFPNASVWGNFTDPGIGLPGEDVNLPDFDPTSHFRKLPGGRLGWNQLFSRQTKYRRPDPTWRVVYISINTCLQPRWNGSSTQTVAPPQLTLYVSNTTSNKNPGPNVTDNTQVVLPLDEGFAKTWVNISSDIYMAVAAPSLPANFSGVWNYNLAASIDGYYHEYHRETFLHLVDTDTNSALLVTDNLTQAVPEDREYQQWMNLSTPFIVYAQNKNDSIIMGVKNSACGLLAAPAQIVANAADPGGVTEPVQMGMITRGMGNKPKEQFYIKGLNASSEYEVFMSMKGNSTQSGSGVVGGGGQVWSPVTLQTKQDGNCALIYNLSFCSEVAYAVPSNPYTFPSTDSLSALYDNYAANMYQNFNKSLQQIPCNTTSSAQYSLAQTCTECAAAYKQWLCAVTMPRCEDYSATYSWLQPRNMAQRFINSTASTPAFLPAADLSAPYSPMSSAPRDSAAWAQTYASVFASNSSRNPGTIDEIVMPGPYKEVLPCNDLCYSLVQACPASFGFGCPSPGKGLERDYGVRSGNASDLTCSYLGAVYYLNAAGRVGASVGWAVVVAGLVGVVVGG